MVSDYLRALLAGQVHEHSLVVWFDPGAHYGAFVRALSLPDCTIACYEGSFFALRARVEPLLLGDHPPKLLVYVPIAEHDTHDALVELTVAGAVLQPGAHPAERNTRLSHVTWAALRGHSETWTDAAASEIARQVECGQVTSLAAIDRVAAKGSEAAGIIPLIFGTGNPADVALQFLASTQYDGEIIAKGAAAALVALLDATYGGDHSADADLANLRKELAGSLLRTELYASLAEDLPAALGTMRVATTPASREACVTLCRTWRLRYDLRESYADNADRLEADLHLAEIALTSDQLSSCETFAILESQLQDSLESPLAIAGSLAWDEYRRLRALIERRLSSFWSLWPERYPEMQARWSMILTALDLLYTADAIATDLKGAPNDPAALLHLYAGISLDSTPWCLLDTYQRHLERKYHHFSFDAKHDSLDRLIAYARWRYMEIGGLLAERYLHALQDTKFVAPALHRQRDVYATFVAPALKSGKTAYVLVDALRFEMAWELARSLRREYEVSLTPIMATVPTITEIGMAALLPGGEGGARVVPLGKGKLGLQLDSTVLKDRSSRLDWLKRQLSSRMVSATLDQVLPKPKRALAEELAAADLVLITAQEIDALCEGDNIHLARRYMDDMLAELRRLANKLRDLGCMRIIIAADHGYLFGDELDSDMKISPPGGETHDLHRRVWIGRGGAADDAYLRVPLKVFGLSDELDIAVPWGFGAFMVQGGARAYFHGGMSPQEMVAPVLVLTPARSAHAQLPTSIAWKLIPGSRRISTRFFSVRIDGQVSGLFGQEPPRVRVEMRVKSDIVSRTVAASYGFLEATTEIGLRWQQGDTTLIEPNHVTLMLDPEALQKARAASIYLLDTNTGRTLASIEDIGVAIVL